MTRPVVCGFEPFGGRRGNRSWDAVSRLGDVADVEQLPVDFAALPDAVRALVARRPSALLLVGEARRPIVTIEAVALNVVDTDRADNAGRRVADQPLVPGGPLALRADWSARDVAAAVRAVGLRAAPSFHAGTYACNAALYVALEAAGGGPPKVGFVHVPAAPWPRTLDDESVARALRVCLAALDA